MAETEDTPDAAERQPPRTPPNRPRLPKPRPPKSRRRSCNKRWRSATSGRARSTSRSRSTARDIDDRLDEKFSELVTRRPRSPGFRPGKAPRKTRRTPLPERGRATRSSGEVLLASLEQLAEEHDVAPLAPPDLDPAQIDIPKEGPLIYEFEVEVRPQFDLPNYKGLKLKRPVQTFSDSDVAREERRLLEPYGQLVPKEGKDPKAEIDDFINCDIKTEFAGQVLNESKEVRIRLDPRLAFKDGVAEDFGKQMAGAKAGDHRTVDIKLSDAVADPALRGQTVKATFAVKDVKTVRMPELTPDLLDQFGVSTEEQLDELLRVVLQRRLEYHQRQSAREQVINLVAEKALATCRRTCSSARPAGRSSGRRSRCSRPGCPTMRSTAGCV